MPTLTPAQLTSALPSSPRVERRRRTALVRDFAFPDFAAAMRFVNPVAGSLAEAANHHPDIDIRYNRVRLALTSHDSGGITARDLNLATQISALSHRSVKTSSALAHIRTLAI